MWVLPSVGHLGVVRVWVVCVCVVCVCGVCVWCVWCVCMCVCVLQRLYHTLSIAFWHLPPNSARFSYATEGALFISVQLSTDAVSALRKVWVII